MRVCAAQHSTGPGLSAQVVSACLGAEQGACKAFVTDREAGGAVPPAGALEERGIVCLRDFFFLFQVVVFNDENEFSNDAGLLGMRPFFGFVTVMKLSHKLLKVRCISSTNSVWEFQ